MHAASLHSLLYRATFCQAATYGELEAIEVKHPLFSATVLLQGAQLMSFIPRNDSDWLWTSPKAEYKQSQSVRGGIPICWPWFGDPARNPDTIRHTIAPSMQQQAHGFARTYLWQPVSLKETSTEVVIQLRLETDRLRLGWRGRAMIEATFSFSASACRIELTSTNLQAHTISISQALHTYLPTGDIKHTIIKGLERTRFIDAVHQWQSLDQLGHVEFCEETDRIYNGHGTLRLITPEHETQLESQNSKSCVVWNPWQEKSRRLSQFDETLYPSMVCIETANVLDDAITLGPQESRTLDLCLTRSART